MTTSLPLRVLTVCPHSERKNLVEHALSTRSPDGLVLLDAVLVVPQRRHVLLEPRAAEGETLTLSHSRK